MVMQAYPKSPYAPNDVAFWYAQRQQWDRSLEFLRIAERADSTDALVLYNLGWANEHLHRRDPALRWYRRALLVADAGQNGEILQSARERLTALGASAALLATPPRPVAAAPRPATAAKPATPAPVPATTQPAPPPATSAPPATPEPATPDTAHTP